MAPDYVLLVFEDAYAQALLQLVKSLRRDREAGARLPLEVDSSRGYSSMPARVAERLRLPDARNHRPRLVVAVADADKAHEFSRTISLPPREPGAGLEAWVVDTERKWFQHIADTTRLTDTEQTRLRVVLVRWSRESFLTACPEQLLTVLGPHPELLDYLSGCKPDPRGATDEAFLHYAKPGNCLENAFKRAGRGRFAKNREGEDLLKSITSDASARAVLWRRAPDLRRLIDILLKEETARGQPVS